MPRSNMHRASLKPIWAIINRYGTITLHAPLLPSADGFPMLAMPPAGPGQWPDLISRCAAQKRAVRRATWGVARTDPSPTSWRARSKPVKSATRAANPRPPLAHGSQNNPAPTSISKPSSANIERSVRHRSLDLPRHQWRPGNAARGAECRGQDFGGAPSTCAGGEKEQAGEAGSSPRSRVNNMHSVHKQTGARPTGSISSRLGTDVRF